MKKSFLPLLLLLTLAATALWAHLSATRTLPAEGAEVTALPRIQVWFNQQPDLPLSRLSLTGPDGEVALGEVESDGEKDLVAEVTGSVSPGSYRATWRTAGDDGHVIEGSWSFTVGAAP